MMMVEKATGRQFIVLAKLINEKLIGCTATFELFFAIAHKKGISSLHKFDPDLGFICLGFEGKMAEHPLLLNSKFYDLDVKEENDDDDE